ncbi:MAG: hypothetical protein JMDDDDMK_01163 [Acidobacteria bacterium]|nr:hypothetical protein [Acidobacteriota bacterium]
MPYRPCAAWVGLVLSVAFVASAPSVNCGLSSNEALSAMLKLSRFSLPCETSSIGIVSKPPDATEVEAAWTKRFDAMTLTDAVEVAPPCDCGKAAVIVTGPPIATAVTVKSAETAPAGIVTVGGTVAMFVFDEARVTVTAVLCDTLMLAVIVPWPCGCNSSDDGLSPIDASEMSLATKTSEPPP